MILAHLPSGYLLGRSFGQRRGRLLLAAMIGAGLPDLDMIWFALVNSQVHHHRFWPHIPAVWAGIALVALPLARWLRPDWLAPLAMGFAGIFLHLILDTWAGSILWLWPVSDHLYSIVTVPATQSHWVLSFLLHWSFLPELAICGAALYLFLRGKAPADTFRKPPS